MVWGNFSTSSEGIMSLIFQYSMKHSYVVSTTKSRKVNPFEDEIIQTCLNHTFTGPTDPDTLDPKLINPVFDVFCRCLPMIISLLNIPKKTRTRLWFGVKHTEVCCSFVCVYL